MTIKQLLLVKVEHTIPSDYRFGTLITTYLTHSYIMRGFGRPANFKASSALELNSCTKVHHMTVIVHNGGKLIE